MHSAEFNLNIAVVIGINDYQNGVPALGTAKQDAEVIAEILREHQYEVHLLIDDLATGQNLRQFLATKLPEILKSEASSRLLFYFAGHGIALNGDEGPQGYLIPQDGKLGDVATYLPMQQVEALLTQLSCRHCLTIMDCCFAGAFRWSSTRKLIAIPEEIHKERYDRFIQDPAWQVITSAAADQYALDSLDLKADRGVSKNNTRHSPFAAALIEALRGAADVYPPKNNGKPAGDGVITATELYMYLRDSVEISTDAKQQRQTPQIWCLKKHDKGEYIFLSPGHQLNLPEAPSLNELEETNPYRGLKSYEAADSNLFFGRTVLIGKLWTAMIDRPFTVVLGASGSGKSSLVKAGLIPLLGRERVEDAPIWKVLKPIRPGELPLNSLYAVLSELTESSQSLATEQTRQFTDAVAAWMQTYPHEKLLLTIDQLEELITLCRQESERQQFLELLSDLLAAYPDRLRLMVTLRSDFEPQFRNTPLESFWPAGRFVVPAMSREELREVIEEPASAKVVYFESREDRGDLVDLLIDEVAGMPGSLPLLSFALSELYLKLARRYLEAETASEIIERSITWADYDQLGGVTKSLTCRADELYDELVKVDPAYAQTIRHVMLRMVAIGGEMARRQVPESELRYPEPENTRVQAAIDQLLSARLLVSSTDANGRPYIEPAHDALVRGWEKLRTWKTEQEERLLLQRRLTPAAEEWDRVKNNDKAGSQGFLDKADPIFDRLDRLLLPVTNLAVSIPTQLARISRKLQKSKPDQNQQKRSREKTVQFLWSNNPYIDVLTEQVQINNNFFNQNETEFIQASILRKYRNTRLWGWGTISFVSVLSGLTIYALWNQNEVKKAQFQTSVQSSDALLSSGQHLQSIFGMIKAGKTINNDSGLINLIDILSQDRIFSPDRSLQLQAIETLRKIDSKTIQFNRWKAHARPVTAVVFNPSNRQMIVSAGEDGNIKIWNQNGSVWKNNTIDQPTLNEPGGQVWSVDISNDGLQLVAGSEDGNIRLWRRAVNGEFKKLPTKDLSTPKVKEEHGVLTVAFNKNAFEQNNKSIAAIASGRADGKVSLWDKNGNWLVNLDDAKKEIKSTVYSVSFSSDGSQIVTAGEDGVKLWKISSTKEGKISVAYSQPLYPAKKDERVFGVSYSPDGSRIASSHSDGTIKIWKSLDGKDWKQQPDLKDKHRGAVRAINFSPDGSKIVSSGRDETVKLWNKDGDLLETFTGHKSNVRFASFNADASMIASTGEDNSIQLWKINNTFKPQVLPKHKDAIYAVDFSHDTDRSWVATADKRGEIKIWTRTSAGLDSTPCLLTGKEYKHEESVRTLAFVPNSSILASADDKGKIIFWHLSSSKEFKTCLPIRQTVPEGNGHDKNIRRITFTSDGSEMATTEEVDGDINKKIVIWRREANEYKYSQSISTQDNDHPKNDGYAVRFSPDKQLLVLGHNNKTIRIWKRNRDKNNRFEENFSILAGHKSGVQHIDFSPDGSMLASASSDGVVKLWKKNLLGTYEVSKEFSGHDGVVDALAFHPDGKMIASGGQDKTVKLWYLDSDQPITLSHHENRVFGVAFSPDGKNMASVGFDQKLVYWDLNFLDLKWLLQQNCNWIKDYLQNSTYVEENDRKLCSRISD
jgi:WD40 repeat protein